MAEKLYCEAETRIKEYIFTNKLKAGDKLPSERTFAQMYHVGRNIIREALKLLSEERVIEIRERSGAYVLDNSDAKVISSIKEEFMSDAADLKGVLEVRKVLEPFVIRKCIDNISNAQLEKLEDLQDKMKNAESAAEFAELNIEFHETIAESTGNPALKTVMCMLYNVLGEKIFHLPYADPASNSETIEEHEMIIRYIKAKDTAKCVECILRHVESGERDLEYISNIKIPESKDE